MVDPSTSRPHAPVPMPSAPPYVGDPATPVPAPWGQPPAGTVPAYGPWAVVGPPGGAQAPTPSWGWGDVLIGVVLFFAVQLVAGFALAAVLVATGQVDLGAGETGLDDETLTLWMLALVAPMGWAVMIGWPWWVSRRKGTGSLARDFGLAARWIDVPLGIGSAFVALMISGAAGLTYLWLFDRDAPTNTDIIPSEPSSPGLVALLLVLIAVGTPIAEEIFFRGLALGAARKRSGPVLGIVYSSALFGVVHLQMSLEGWLFVGVTVGFVGAVFAGVRYLAQGRIAACIIGHMLFNGTAVVVVMFGPS